MGDLLNGSNKIGEINDILSYNGDNSVVKVGMVSLGCPKNQMDAELMLSKIEAAGFNIVPESGLADVVIVNTCGFIEASKEEAIENILEFAKLKEEGRIKKIIVTGCLAQRYKEEIAQSLPECDAVIGLGANETIVDVVKSVSQSKEQLLSFPDRKFWSLEGDRLQTTPGFFAYLRISDGCDNNCTYCAIPSIRGSLRSRKIEDIVKEGRTLAENGVKEIVLVAQDTTLYGQDIYGEPRIAELLNRLCEIEGLKWIRLLYCYPEHITDELIDIIAREEKIVSYLDIPIQHCDDDIIKRMHRKGSEEELRSLINKLRERIPGVVLRTTLIVGFPGETEEQFQKLCDFTADMKFDRLGCFTYSREEGTAAARFDDQIDEDVKRERYDIIMNQQTIISDRINSGRIGQVLDVLVEEYDRYAGCYFGRSYADAPDIDFKVFFPRPDFSVKAGDFVKVEITDIIDLDLMGECVG